MSPLRDNPLLRLAFGFAAGVAIADVLQRLCQPLADSAFVWFAAVSLLLAVGVEWGIRRRRRGETHRSFLFRRPLIGSLLLLLSVVALGGWRYQTVRDRVVVTWPAEAVDGRAVIRGGPVCRQRSVRYLLDVNGHRLYGYLFGSDEHDSWAWGDTLLLEGVTIRPPMNFSDSLTFDYARWLYSQRISGTAMIPAAKATRLPLVPQATTVASVIPSIMRLRGRVTGWLRSRYAAAGLPDDVLGIVEALSLGDKSALGDDVRDVYADAGASHLMALSGLHVGVLYMLLTMTFGLLFHSRIGRRLCGLLAVGLLWAFTLLADFPPSLVRAVTMFTVYAVVALLSGDRSPLSALALTALVMVGIQPFLLFDVGFQLSFASMLSILLLMPQWEALHVHMPLLGRSRLLAAPVAVVFVSMAAQVGVAPLVLHYFGRFPTFFLVTNMVIQPLFYVVMTLIVVWIALSWTPLAPFLTGLLVYAVRGMNSLLAAIAQWPGSTLDVIHFTLLDALLLWLTFYFLLRYLIKRHLPSAILALASIALLLLSRLFS